MKPIDNVTLYAHRDSETTQLASVLMCAQNQTKRLLTLKPNSVLQYAHLDILPIMPLDLVFLQLIVPVLWLEIHSICNASMARTVQLATLSTILYFYASIDALLDNTPI
jgi:hypothetical protein